MSLARLHTSTLDTPPSTPDHDPRTTSANLACVQCITRIHPAVGLGLTLAALVKSTSPPVSPANCSPCNLRHHAILRASLLISPVHGI